MTPQEGGTSGTGVQVVENIRSSIHGVTDEDSVAHDTKSDSIKFLRLAGETGVLDQATVDMMLARLTGDPEELPALEAPKEDDIADAEIVETPE